MSVAVGSPSPELLEIVERVRNATAAHGRDRSLVEGQQWLSFDTRKQLYGAFTRPDSQYPPGSRPELERAAAAFVAGARPGLATALALTAAVSRFAAATLDSRDRAEETLLSAESLTPLERARLLAMLAQVAGLGARVCLLYRASEPAFHAVCELRIMAAWSVFDPLANVCFVMGHHPYASAWELNRLPALADRHPAHGIKPTVDASFYRTIGISNMQFRPFL